MQIHIILDSNNFPQHKIGTNLIKYFQAANAHKNQIFLTQNTT